MKQYKILLMALAAAMLPGVAAHAQAPVGPSPAAGSISTPEAVGTAPLAGTASAVATTNSAAPAATAPDVSKTAAPAAKPAAAAATPQFEQPEPGIGQPTDRIGIQPQVTDIGKEALWFHDALLMPIITAISLLVLALLLYVIARYNRRSNPNPSRTSHNTLIEVIWTLVPVLILLIIAVPSIKLLARQYNPPKADLTVKVIGHQWYWSYQYPDNGDFEVVSNILTDAQDKAKGEPRLLGVDERLVVPAGAVVKVITTSDDVIHSFAVPAFWVKMDAVPGRLNETWFKVDRPGLYYGQCSELCGARHAYMPIAVEVVPPADFAAWVKAKGGTMPGQGAAPASSDATANSPVSNPHAGTSAATPEPSAAATGPTENASAPVAPTAQLATAN